MNRIVPLLLSLVLCMPLMAQKESSVKEDENLVRKEQTDPVIRKLYGPGGPYAQFDPEQEIPEKRTETAKHFRNADGTETALLTAGPMHYFENGKWLTSSNELVPVNMPLYPGYVLMNRHNQYKTLYGKAGMGIAVKKNDGTDLLSGYTQESIQLYSMDKKLLKNVMQYNKQALPQPVSGSDNRVEYGVGQDISVQVTQLTTKIKSEYLITSNLFSGLGAAQYVGFEEQLRFAEPVEVEQDEQKTGLLIKNAAGEILLSYNEARYYEQNRLSSSQFEEAEYLVNKIDDHTWKITLLIPTNWFNNPERVYPVVVDPTITCTPTASIYWTGTTSQDADAHSSDNIKTGFYDCSGCTDKRWYPWAKINLSSIPDGSCIQTANFSMFQHVWRNGGGNDGLRFELGWANVEPVSASWATIRNSIQGLSERYANWDVWGTPANCSGCNGGYDYPESPNNAWKNFNINYALHRNRVAASLAADYITYGLNLTYHASDCFWCWGDETNELEFRGWSDGNRPQLSVTYQTASSAPTSITGTTSICAGSSTTLTASGGSVGSDATIQWFSGSCGSTVIGTGNSITVSPGSTTTYFVRYSGTCNTTSCASATVTVNTASTAPTSITGTTTICAGNSTTLTLSGGSAGTGATAQWFSGSCGSTVIGTGNSITVSPGSTTTYFVRYSGTCNTTSCASATVTVNTASTAPTSITGTTTICAGNSTTLTLSGGSAGTGATAQWFSGSCGSTVIGTGNSITVSPGSTTTYFVRYAGSCNTTSCASATVTVNTASTAPTSITGTTSICAGNSTTLTLSGGSAGTGATAQWFSGSCGGTAVGTGNSITVSPGSTTTYFVRYSGTCNTTSCVSATVTVNTASTAPTSITGTTTICAGNSTTLTLSGGSAGTGATAQWFSGSCGSTVIGTGNSITVSPGSTTTYFVRYSGTCNTTSCVSATVTVNTASTAPTSITGTTTICAGNSTTLTLSGGSAGTGATAQWFSGSCGSTVIGTGNSITVSPGSTTTYFVRYAGSCNTTTCASATVTVNTAPTAFTPVVTTSMPLCYRGSAEISIASSQAGTDYYLRDNTTTVDSWPNSAGGTIQLHTQNLTAGSTDYNVVATTAAGCSLTVSVPAITVTGAAGSLANNNDSRTCYVNGNNAFVEFITSGRSIIAINPGTQNLGDVTVTEYVNGTPIDVQACNTSAVTQPQFTSAALGRHWVISSTIAPVTPIDVRLYIADADITSLAASANANANPNDDVSGIGSLELSRYSGPNENGSFADNCNTGGTTYLHMQSGNGTVTTPVSGNAIAGASYVVYSVGGFSEWWLGGTGNSTPLPVVLSAFNAECKDHAVALSWTTVSEVNNAYFTIERSTDAQSWETVLELPGAGNSNSPLHYTAQDDRPHGGLSYYRLRQTDYNGDMEIFAPQSVICYPSGKGTLRIYPNPSDDYFVLNFDVQEDMNGAAELLDMTGRSVFIRNAAWQQGANTFMLNGLEKLLPGTYILRIQGAGKTLYTAPVIITR